MVVREVGRRGFEAGSRCSDSNPFCFRPCYPFLFYCISRKCSLTHSSLCQFAGISAETSAKDYTGARRRVHELDVSILDRSLAVNVRGVWLFTKHATAQFLAQEPHPSFGYSHSGADTDADTHRGWIVNIASALASAGLAGSASYCASKGAVLQLTRATAIEYASDGIHINALQPGFTDTSLLETTYSMAEGGKEGVEAWLKAVHPLGRTGRPEDIARAAVFLAGDGAGWITGHGLVVDGGFLAQ